MSDIKKGLVMEGGAMRGMFTAGVIDVFLENDICFDGAIGVSAGATFGCNFKSKQIGRSIRYNLRFCKDSRYCGIKSLLTSGNLYNADFCYNQLPNNLDLFDYETYKNNPLKFYIVASDVRTGLPVYKELKSCDKNDLEWMRASASMPLVSKVVEIDGFKLLDGGMTDSIPLKYFESIGYNRNVVILTQPRDFIKKENKLIKIIKLFLSKYPKIVDAMKNRHIMYNSETKYIFDKADKGEVFVICPETSLGISRTESNGDKLMNTYQLGRDIAKKNLDSLRAFLNV